METPPGTPPRKEQPSYGFVGRPNENDPRQMALDVRAQRDAKRPIKNKKLREKIILWNGETGYVDPSVAHVFKNTRVPPVVPQGPVKPYNWSGAYATAISHQASLPSTRIGSPINEVEEESELEEENPRGTKRQKGGKKQKTLRKKSRKGKKSKKSRTVRKARK